jgi:hypothetical protein
MIIELIFFQTISNYKAHSGHHFGIFMRVGGDLRAATDGFDRSDTIAIN